MVGLVTTGRNQAEFSASELPAWDATRVASIHKPRCCDSGLCDFGRERSDSFDLDLHAHPSTNRCARPNRRMTAMGLSVPL